MFGINWYCNQFGQITREAPQDFLLQKYFEVTPALNYAGFGAPNVINLMNQDLTDCPSGKSNFSYGYTKFKVLQDPINSHVISDFKPAKYYFDFFGYKGYFVFDNDKKPLVYCETANLIVDMPSGFVGGFNCSSVTQPLSVNETSPEIRIQDDKGNNFYFGGSYDALEVNYSENLNYGNYQTIDNNNNTYSQSYACVTRANYIISWNLSKVVLANGDIILGKYKTGNSSVFNSFMQDTLNNSPTILSVKLPFLLIIL